MEHWKDWKDDDFINDIVFKKSNTIDINTRLDYIKKFKNEWESIHIYEYYNGIQVTLTINSISKDVLLVCDGDEMESIEIELAKIIMEMSKLDNISYGSRFPSEASRIFHTSPVKKVCVQDINCLRFIKSYEGVEFLEIINIIFDDEDLNLPFIPNLKEFVIRDLEMEGDENIFDSQTKKAFPNACIRRPLVTGSTDFDLYKITNPF
jgi:hypothetical protein